MALANTRDPQESAAQLSAWLQTKLDGATDVVVTDVETPQASGMSNETLLFTASWNEGGTAKTGRYVARVAPQTAGVFPRYDLVAEQRVMQALNAHSEAPTPATPWVETDESVLGSQFLVMERLDGRVASDDPPFTAAGWVLDLTPEQRAAMCDNALIALAAIHKADYLELGLGFLDRPDLGKTPLDQQIADWTQTYDWAREGEVNPTIASGFEWIAANRPTDEQTVLNWGDARIGNMLVADDMSINGVLDWEMVTIGSPDQDLGWWLFLLRHHTEGIGMELPAGFPNREQTIARYEELAGNRVDNIDFYEAFAALKLSILMHRAGNMMIAGGMLPPDAPMKFSNPASQLLAKLIGAPAPTGTSQSFIGNR
ncbi:MAG TPA: phosphotransferase family protein [Mycobacteriales bacterium]|nr:phosphotransferase family protein [Mycobacteriales bacterium]